MESLASRFERAFEHNVSVSSPFRDGYIIQSRAAEMPWVQLELSRAIFMTDSEERSRVSSAFQTWCEGLLRR